MMELDEIEKELLGRVADISGIPEGAYNFRVNGKSIGKNSTANIEVETKTDKSGLNVKVKPGTKKDVVHIPVIISKSGHKETVYNDFYIGDNSEVTIVAGCGIYNCGAKSSIHDGVHVFHVGKNCKVKYIEKHYGTGPSAGKILNPTTELHLEENSYVELELEQIAGVDSTNRLTKAELEKNAKINVVEKLLTHGRQVAKSNIEVNLNGENSTADIVSRSVARDISKQDFKLHITGKTTCRGHSECNAIITDDAKVVATPSLNAESLNAELIHEAAIGKIAGTEINKLMTLGLTSTEAEAQIINGFLK
ncbi:SufD family Fe-S cluster assembly protein [Candidatus Saccharibacteria bacterium]|nr:SufD family Fe-S cluster assembly protein [Candidatus Saccharibacteria bacterium]